MSIRVELDELRETVAAQAPFAYLLTVSDDQRAHAVAVTPAVGDDEIVCDGGSRTRANAAARPNVSLLWPPSEAGGYSLIVDGVATVAGETVRVTPARAVRHRPAPGGGSDCAPVMLEREE